MLQSWLPQASTLDKANELSEVQRKLQQRQNPTWGLLGSPILLRTWLPSLRNPRPPDLSLKIFLSPPMSVLQILIKSVWDLRPKDICRFSGMAKSSPEQAALPISAEAETLGGSSVLCWRRRLRWAFLFPTSGSLGNSLP